MSLLLFVFSVWVHYLFLCVFVLYLSLISLSIISFSICLFLSLSIISFSICLFPSSLFHSLSVISLFLSLFMISFLVSQSIISFSLSFWVHYLSLPVSVHYLFLCVFILWSLSLPFYLNPLFCVSVHYFPHWLSLSLSFLSCSKSCEKWLRVEMIFSIHLPAKTIGGNRLRSPLDRKWHAQYSQRSIFSQIYVANLIKCATIVNHDYCLSCNDYKLYVVTSVES